MVETVRSVTVTGRAMPDNPAGGHCHLSPAGADLSSDIVVELVADAVNREDVLRLGGVRFYLAAQVFDVGVDAAVVTLVGDAMQVVQQLRTRKNLPGMTGEGGQAD